MISENAVPEFQQLTSDLRMVLATEGARAGWVSWTLTLVATQLIRRRVMSEKTPNGPTETTHPVSGKIPSARDITLDNMMAAQLGIDRLVVEYAFLGARPLSKY